jgi:hypothetical protein
MSCLRFLAFFLACLLACTARADEVLITLDASGEIEIGPDGRVVAHRLDQNLRAPVAKAIARNIETWTFEPVLEDGKPVIAVTRMHLVIEAIEQSKDAVALRLKHVWFGDQLTLVESKAPRYPTDAIRARLDAHVVLALRLDEEGRVVDAHPFRTSFAPGVARKVANRFRPRFEKVSVEAARQWRYSAEVSRPGGITVYAPVTFVIDRTGQRGTEGRWLAWEPGDAVPPPWLSAETVHTDSPALAEGKAMLADERIRLVSDPVGNLL